MSKSTINLTVDSGPRQGETLDRKPGSVIRVGRVVKGNTLAIKDGSISQKHLTIEFDPHISRWVLRDLDTSNGTFVNGARVPSSASVHLSDGDAIKVGECSFISVKISVIEENAEGNKGNGGRKGRGRPKRAADCEEDAKSSAKEEILNSGVDSRTEVMREKGPKRSVAGEPSEDGILGSTGDDMTEAKGLRRGKRKNPSRGFQGNSILGMSADDKIEMPKNLEKSGKAGGREDLKDRNCKRVCMKDETYDSVMQDGSKEEPKHLDKGRKRNSTRNSKRPEILGSALADRVKELQKGGREERNCSTISSSKDEIPGKAAEGEMDAFENLGRERRRKSTKVSMADGVIKGTIKVPKTLARRTRSSSSLVVEKDPNVNSIVEDKTVQVEKFEKEIGKSSAHDFMHNDALVPAMRTSIEAPKNLRRNRRSNQDPLPKKDEVPQDNTKVLKTTGGRRRTRSIAVLEKDDILDQANDDKIQVPKKVGRTRRNSSINDSQLDETSYPLLEDRTEAPKNLRRGKRMANSSKISKTDEVSDVAVADAVEVAKGAGKGKPRRAPTRRTRASSKVSEDEKSLWATQSDLKNPVLNSLENLHQSKRPRNHQLGRSGKIKHIAQISSCPADSMNKRSQTMEDKENYVSVECQKIDDEATAMEDSCHEGNSDGGRLISGQTTTQNNNPLSPLPKMWNGNGIPNTTTKYKEDSKVNWHATPFEERLEKALSGDKILLQRELTN